MILLRGLPQLTWLETKIFLREPMGAIGTIAVPVLTFVVLGRIGVGRTAAVSSSVGSLFGAGGVPVLVSILIANSAVLSLVTIIAIYREGGILKRLRATPLRPLTILSAHVLVKLAFTAATMILMMLAGRRYYTAGPDVPLVAFGLALLLTTWSILSIGFVIASIVPTARFAQPVGAVVLYPMIALSGLFVPLASLPPGLRAAARILPMTYGVSLLEGIWRGEGWVAHAGDVGGLVVVFLLCSAIASKVFRWE
ncbi:MAG: ABC transporter permease [Gemmatimonadota bacterium]|nr:ABC transporter permease [Gemmatimonadota bacterium]